jgi:Na+-transporting NADH:ubiquinone oxidoreductase subunit C
MKNKVKSQWYPVVFCAVLGIVCAALMAGSGWLTKSFRDANARAEEVRNVLSVLQVPVPEKADSRQLLALFQEKVRAEKRGDQDVYVLIGPGGTGGGEAVALPFHGQALWGPVKGFLALEGDMKTIRGLTVYEQEETPGLGGEIAAPWWQEQFKGKSIMAADGRPGIRIRRGKGSNSANEVDGITGATLTCGKVEAMLNKTITTVAEEDAGHVR